MAEPWVMPEGKKFFRRQGWNGKVGSGKPPLWHRIKKVRQAHIQGQNAYGEPYDRLVYIWTAECGYELKINVTAGGPMTAIGIKTKSKLCSKCEAKVGTQ